MNINRINGIYPTYGPSNTTKTSNTQSTTKASDAIDISNEAKDFQTAFKEAMKADDVREEIVNDIKDKMDKGEYEMDTDALVDKILNNKK